ncbi:MULTISPECIES: universal stress protein [Bacillus]|uniref:universal stress protein n=1 Tax=Bacillus TaxID=1386 RepID=UPI000BB789B5|nr:MULTISPECIES: universal stress protein [Bacillus]
MFKNILLAADASENSLRAAEKALELAKLVNGSKITLIYVVDGKTSKSDVLRSWDLDGIKHKREEKMRAIEVKANEANVQYEVLIVRGEPAETIYEYANNNKMDIVIIGSRGLNPLQEMVLGSVSHKVMKRAECPVMVVK